jgi:glycosyltransferase involved in cell wall biosynthesis
MPVLAAGCRTMSRPFTTTLMIPTLNEVEGMKAIMPRIRREWVDQILIVDGKSTDGTAEYAREHGYDLVIQQERGLRHAFNEALPHIRGEVMITFSPDGNSIPELIPPLLDKMEEGFDMVIVSRYLGQAASEDDDVMTGFGNWLFTRTVNRLFGAAYTDAMVMYRAYKTRIYRELELEQDRWYRTPEKLFFTRLGIEPMLSARAARRKLKISEIPGDEPARIGGERKLQMFRWGAGYYFQFLRDYVFWH